MKKMTWIKIVGLGLVLVTINVSSIMLTACHDTIPPPPVVRCAGDCDGNQAVTIAEVIHCINIKLKRSELSTCPVCDANGDGMVDDGDTDEVIRNFSAGCPIRSSYRANMYDMLDEIKVREAYRQFEQNG